MFERLPFLIQHIRFLEYVEYEEKGDRVLVTPPICYNLDIKNKLPVLPVLSFTYLIRERYPAVSSVLNPEYYSIEIPSTLLYVISLLEREATLKILEKNMRSTSGFSFAKRVRSAQESVTYRSVYGLIMSKNNELSERNLFRLKLARSKSLTMKSHALAIQNLGEIRYKKIVHMTGRYLFIGYVTPDSNTLRKNIWSYLSFLKSSNDNFQKIEHRKVIILFDIKKSRFIVQSCPEIGSVCRFFDNMRDTDVESKLDYENEEYKRLEMKLEKGKAYSDVCTRVFNLNEFRNDPEGDVMIFSLDNFLERYYRSVPIYIPDTDISQYKDQLGVYPVSYTILIYSIIRTWLHMFSRYFPQSFKLEMEDYEETPFVCCFDILTNVLTNSFVRGRSRTTIKNVALRE